MLDTANDVMPKTTPVTVPWSTQFDLTSAINGRSYRIFVFQPPVPPPEAGYPVVTVLDGNMTFPIAAAMAATYAWSACPALVVGVGYASDNPVEWMVARLKDLTPETPLEGLPQRKGLPPTTPEAVGGADAFLRFLTEELRPAIAASHKVDPGRQALFGYSLAGLFTLHALFNHPDAFRSFAAASPSIWWNECAVLDDEVRFARAVKCRATQPRVLISVGTKEQTLPRRLPIGMTAEETLALLDEGRMVDNAWELSERLGKVEGGDGWELAFHAFEDEDHLTGLAASVGRALDFALRD
jgi:uncharacterized protein